MKKRGLCFLMACVLSAGMFLTDSGSVNMGMIKAEAGENLKQPVIEADSQMMAGQKVTWDCVYFGYYPQTEIVSDSSQCGTSKNKFWGSDEDYEADAQLYQQLQTAKYTKNGDTIIEGVKYRRIKKEDTTYASSGAGSEIQNYYRWTNTVPCHYFRYEPIKWRVLDVDSASGKVLLLSDIILDDIQYNQSKCDVTWKTSTVRSWLNGYGAAENADGVDFRKKNFIDTAFREPDKSAVITQQIPNNKNYEYGTDGGENTEDAVFELSEEEAYLSASAKAYGFLSKYEIHDEAKRAKSSTYAKAMGAWSNHEEGYEGNGIWWMRSPGQEENFAAYICNYGLIRPYGIAADSNQIGVRPSLYADLWTDRLTYAGTVSSDGTKESVTAPAADVFSDEVLEYVDDSAVTVPAKPASKVLVSSISLKSSLSKKIAAGKKVRINLQVSPSNASNKSVTWKSSNKKYAAVDKNGVVKTLSAGKGKTVTITAEAKDGSGKRASIKLKIMKDRVKSISLSGTKKIARGKSTKLKLKVKTTGKSANKSVKWTSSNTKIAKVSQKGKVTIFKTAKKGAVVKITAKALDGTNKKKTIKIKVK